MTIRELQTALRGMPRPRDQSGGRSVTGSRSRLPEANPGAGSNPETLSVMTDDSSPTYGGPVRAHPNKS
jgi:hypothetical protein